MHEAQAILLRLLGLAHRPPRHPNPAPRQTYPPRPLLKPSSSPGNLPRLRIPANAIDGVDGVIGGQVARIECLDASCNLSLVERRIDDVHREFRLVVAVAHQKKGFAREFPFEAAEKRRISARTHRLPPQVLVDLRLVSEVAPFRRQLPAVRVSA